MIVNIYTQTNIKSNHPGKGDYIYVLQKEETDVTLTKEGEYEEVTANEAEIKVLLEAVQRLNMACEVIIYTDSSYLASGINCWMSSWKKNDFKNSKGEEIKYRELWMQLAAVTEEQNLIMTHLKTKHPYKEWMIAKLKEKETK